MFIDKRSARESVMEKIGHVLKGEGYESRKAYFEKKTPESNDDIYLRINISSIEKHGDLLLDIYSEVFSRSFSVFQKKFHFWYIKNHQMEIKYENTSVIYKSWDNIYYEIFKVSRNPFYVRSSADLEYFCFRSSDDYVGFVKEWEKKWISWKSVLNSMMDDEHVGGVWRVPIIYYGMEMTDGLPVARDWLARQTPLTPYQADQFRFLKKIGFHD